MTETGVVIKKERRPAVLPLKHQWFFDNSLVVISSSPTSSALRVGIILFCGTFVGGSLKRIVRNCTCNFDRVYFSLYDLYMNCVFHNLINFKRAYHFYTDFHLEVAVTSSLFILAGLEGGVC